MILRQTTCEAWCCTHANRLKPTEQLDRFAAEMYECNASPPCVRATNCMSPPWFPLYLQQLKKNKKQPNRPLTQVPADVTARLRQRHPNPIALIYQKSHSSGKRSVKLAPAETAGVQLPTSEHQIDGGPSRQLSTNVKAVDGT